MTPDRPTIFIVDDEERVRRSMARLLRSAGWDVETFASAREFLARGGLSGTGCVLLDITMPEMTGIELQEKLLEQGISFPVIFLTGYGDVPTSVRAMKKGAVDFLLKPADDEALLGAIRQALERHATSNTQQHAQHAIQQRLSRLTSREREVMQLVIGGHLNKQIADRLGISEKTVKAHRGRVMAKMAAGSVAELVRLCDLGGVQPG